MGKSNDISTAGSSTALYIYPTKALAQDQLQSIEKLIQRIEETMVDIGESTNVKCNVCAVDGDTSFSCRTFAQKNGHILLTNPDMLSCNLLPNHSQWKRFFQNLRFVIVDEAHMYKGVFGSHVSAIMRRLTRVCAFYRSQRFTNFTEEPLQFVLSSATLSNPINHMKKLVPIECLGCSKNNNDDNENANDVAHLFFNTAVDSDCISRECDVISVDSKHDGSPSGDRYYVLWNPPFYANCGENNDNGANSISSQLPESAFQCSVGEQRSADATCSTSAPVKRGQCNAALNNSYDYSITCDDMESDVKECDKKIDQNINLDGEELGTAMVNFLQGCEDGRHTVSERFGDGRKKPEENKAANSMQAYDMKQYSSPCENELSLGSSQNYPGRVSSIMQTALLFTALVQERKRVLAFCQSRKLVELVR